MKRRRAPSRDRRRHASHWMEIALTVACLATMAVWGPFPARADGKKAARPDKRVMPPPLVTVAAVIAQEVDPPAEFVGRIEAVRSVDLRARVQGYLDQVRFDEGATVRAGDLLYVIEQATYQARVDADRARVAQAGATLEKSEKYLSRLETVSSGGVSATDLETTQSDVAQARAALQEAEATLAQSEINLGYTAITAPISGRIGKNAYSQGSLVGPDSGALARIVQVDPIRVVFSVSENWLPRMQQAAKSNGGGVIGPQRRIRIRLPGDQVYPLAGRPDFIDNRVDPATGTIAVRARFDNPDGFLVPGQYVTVMLSLSNPVRLPVVPQAAVMENREGRYVFVVDAGNIARQRRIETAQTQGTVWAVKSGLMPGETIVVEGIQKVRPGAKVQPMAPAKTEGGKGQ